MATRRNRRAGLDRHHAPKRGVQHWTFCVDPRRYDIGAALERERENWWTTKKGDVRRGDLVAVWQLQGAGKRRGIIALGEIVSDIEIRADPSGYWSSPHEPTTPVPRVLVSYTKKLSQPLWLDEHEDALGALAASRARGGSVFRMTPGDWDRVALLAELVPEPGRPTTDRPTLDDAHAKPHRSPPWSRDELILALDLYFRHSPRSINQDHPEVHKLSELLNSLPLQHTGPDAARFRNANGVYMKLCNFLRFDPNYTGKGLTRGARTEEQVWNAFAGDRVRLREVARAIELGKPSLDVATAFDDDPEVDDGVGFPEGRILERIHRARERSSKLRNKAMARAMRLHGRLACVACGFDFAATYGALGDGFIECHHTRPVSEVKPGNVTRVEDLALLCANCHRMVHRKRPWLDMESLATLVNRQ